jgi:hypothetical protein
MNKDRTDKFQKQIQKTMYGNNRQKNTQIYYQYETKYTTTQSTHKVDMPIRPVVNNVNAPSQQPTYSRILN